MKKTLIALLAILVLAVPMVSAVDMVEIDPPVWRLTSMCDAYNGDVFLGHIMRARSETTVGYDGVEWLRVGGGASGFIDLPPTDEGTYVPVYFLVNPKGTVKLIWEGYETVKAMNNNQCSPDDVCNYLGGDYCPNNDVPEFGLIGAGLVALGALGFLIYRRKK